jgi:hypothetical protein
MGTNNMLKVKMMVPVKNTGEPICSSGLEQLQAMVLKVKMIVPVREMLHLQF